MKLSGDLLPDNKGAPPETGIEPSGTSLPGEISSPAATGPGTPANQGTDESSPDSNIPLVSAASATKPEDHAAEMPPEESAASGDARVQQDGVQPQPAAPGGVQPQPAAPGGNPNANGVQPQQQPQPHRLQLQPADLQRRIQTLQSLPVPTLAESNGNKYAAERREAAINDIFFPGNNGQQQGQAGGGNGAQPAQGGGNGAQPAQGGGNAQPPAAPKVNIAQEESAFTPGRDGFDDVHEEFGDFNDVVDHYAGVTGTGLNTLSAVYDNDSFAKGAIGFFSNINNFSVGTYNTISGIESLVYNSRKAHKGGRRNAIKRRNAMSGAFASGFKLLGTASSMFGSAYGIDSLLSKDRTESSKKSAGIASLISSIASFGGAFTGLVSSGMNATAYKKIMQLDDPNLTDQQKFIAGNKTNNRLAKAKEMAASAAKSNYHRSVQSSWEGAAKTVGSICGIVGSGIKMGGGSSLASSILGAVSSGIGEVTKIGSHFHNRKLKKNKAADREAYVNKYLNRKKDKIKQQAADRNNRRPINDLSDDEAKIIAIKQLGAYTGKVVGNGPLTLSEVMINRIYNKYAVKRAKRLHELPANDKGPMLKTLGLQQDATVQEIAEMLGYEK